MPNVVLIKRKTGNKFFTFFTSCEKHKSKKTKGFISRSLFSHMTKKTFKKKSYRISYFPVRNEIKLGVKMFKCN